ncbi:MAG: glycosyltransferase, partial [Candidatus Babeliales bacterium]|nr:glycosyltransferase [Candidatus Babeliales bacterium]
SKLPEKFKAYAQSWQLHHPDWEYKLWTDADIAQLILENQTIYDQAINYAERSDIARYEILYRFGGLYVDTDCECIQPFDTFHYAYDFYAGLELPAMALFLQPIIMPNALIGSMAGHPIMRTCIDNIKNNSNASSDIVIKTGPLLFTKAVLENIDCGNTIDIVLPASYFYPIDKNTHERAMIESLFQPETYAVHHWAGSWILKEEAFVPGIKIRSVITGNTIRFTIVDER